VDAAPAVEAVTPGGAMTVLVLEHDSSTQLIRITTVDLIKVMAPFVCTAKLTD